MKIAIIGLGYIGLPLALILKKKKKIDVIGIDTNIKKNKLINKGISPIKDINLTEQIKATDDFEKIKDKDIIIVCVPTPIDKENKPDLTALKKCCEQISKYLTNQLIIIESTISPGTCEEILKPILKTNNIAHCPERVDPGNKKYTLENIPRVIGSLNNESLEKAYSFYKSFINAEITRLSSIKTAEATKIMENAFRDINIAFINEMAKSFDKLNINILEVIKGASTKPFAFLPHYPGCGVGGHCFEKNSMIFLKNSNHQKIKKIGSYIDSLECKKQVIDDAIVFYPHNLKILSYDMIKKKTSFKPVKLASKRKTNQLFRINCSYNYKLEVTDLHPVICYENGLKIKFAKDITSNDKVVLNKNLPSKKDNIKIDLIQHLNEELINKIRVKLKNKSFTEFKEIIDKNLKGRKRDYFRYNSFPLKKYLEVENLLNIKREDILLCTGRGPSFKKISCIFNINKNFLRLIGYYLSEGCITKDKSLRTRFTFHKKEIGYIDDLKNILKNLNIDFSTDPSKIFESYTIKVSSMLFGFLLKNILKCGTNCYNMNIPEIFFDLKKELKEELLKGLFRGDGGVSFYSGKKKYKKNNKLFRHNRTSIDVSYFTSSEVLFQQIILFLLNLEIIPRLSKRKGYLTLHGFKDIYKIKDWFLDEKKDKIDNYLNNLQKKIDYKKTEIHKDFITINIENIEKIKTDYAYSLEVEDTNTLIISSGIIAHNCIPVDPYYLIDKAKEHNFNHKFLQLAREINNSMPKYTVDKLLQGLKEINKDIRDVKITVLGLTYKANIDDIRESSSLKIIEELKKNKANIIVYDPYILEKSDVKTLNGALNTDIILIATAHDEFLNIYDKLNNIKLIIDGRNCLDRNKIPKNIIYKGIGR